ncbi:ribonuclease toxin HepT-like protein [Leptolyngbya sp. NIES-2104]|uniref:ribonuclease toxin HepT-like protein n=1 Tax=Leptolyngbya sp. NIES-2104 TaxID=1552121 RepID=UPI0006EC737A|nr:hypothetical protein [Leptolyngbya sp. NIES-2104]GAP98673.1 hypothetical protein NIES2104_52290 [Leptolyngbya sp. NIES-2104]
MSEILLELADRIITELEEIEQVVDRTQQSWRRFQQSGDDLYIDSVALNLHGFYNGLERLFELIAAMIDRTRPQGNNWHQMLLIQMVNEVEEVRPAVISEANRVVLDEYRRFRHIVRHLYTQQFEAERIQPLVEAVPDLFSQVRAELAAFAAFLRSQGA